MSVIIGLIGSILALLWAANHLVSGAAALASRLNLSPLIIGMTILGLGTSTPEIMIAVLSSIKDQNNLTIGNAIGSNIANLGLVIGLTMLIKPMHLNTNILRKAFPILIIAMLFVYGLIQDGFLGKIDGCLFLISCIALISYCLYLANHVPPHDLAFIKLRQAVKSSRSMQSTLLSIAIGILILPLSAKYAVTSAAELARWSGISELTIGLTILAIGTTLPELATSITAALKGEEDLAIGTILGSNIYNLLLILAFPALINPAKVNTSVLWRDMPMMMSLTLLFIFLNLYYKDKLSRWHGGILLLVYCSYIVSLVIRAQS